MDEVPCKRAVGGSGGYAKNLTNDDKSKIKIIIIIMSTWKKSSVEVK